MKNFIERLFLKHWPRKLVALISAIIIWFLVNQSLTLTRTIPNASVRLINLPADKTVEGILPGGILCKRIPVTVTGTKSIVEELTPADFEIVINTEGKNESWIATIDKKSLVSLDPELHLKQNIKEVSAHDLFIKLTKLVTAEIPVVINTPIGEAPPGYQFLDVWPKQLVQTVSGPQEQIETLKEKGLELTFNIDRIPKAELDALKEVQNVKNGEEVTFAIPYSWKEVAIPFRDYSLEPINDPRAELLRIDFLKKDLLPLGTELPLALFFPLKYSASLNPDSISLAPIEIVEKRNGLKVLTTPLFIHDVSRLFLDVVKDNLQLTIFVVPRNVKKTLDLTLEFIDRKTLEDSFVERSLQAKEIASNFREEYLRQRFRTYTRQFALYLSEQKPLELSAKLQGNTISLQLEASPKS